VYGQIGAYDRGIQALRQALDSLRNPESGVHAGLAAAISMLYLQKGEIALAESFYSQARRPISRDSYIDFTYLISLAEACFALYRQDYRAALRALDSLEDNYIRADWPFLLTDRLLLKSKALIGLSRLEEARQAVLDARAASGRNQSRRNRWEILALLAQVEDRLGNSMESLRLLQQARDEILYLADQTLPADLRDPFLEIPSVRAVLDDTRGSSPPKIATASGKLAHAPEQGESPE
jgi:tetratricopeptide (TPR) repeat protein